MSFFEDQMDDWQENDCKGKPEDYNGPFDLLSSEEPLERAVPKKRSTAKRKERPA
jgi:hypothetical protein